MVPSVKIIECPRDAMQGIKTFIPTAQKIQYLQSLLRVGFDTIDFGSFVSSKAIPQMSDTAQVLEGLDLSSTSSKLLSIVANSRGAETALMYPEIDYLGYPFSISEIFQMRNTHKTIAQSEAVLDTILNLADQHNREVVVYISMAFGNPYGDPWNIDVLVNWINRMDSLGVRILSLSDTVGTATPEAISYAFRNLIPSYSHIEFGAHLHTSKETWFSKVEAAFESGCSRFDGAIQGFGGCPMAKDDLTGNMPTEKLLSFFNSKKIQTNLNALSFESAHNEASKIFINSH